MQVYCIVSNSQSSIHYFYYCQAAMFSVLESGLSTSLFVFLFSIQLVVNFNSELIFGSKIWRSNGLKRSASLSLSDAMAIDRVFLALVTPNTAGTNPRVPNPRVPDPYCTLDRCGRVRGLSKPSYIADPTPVAS
jgi:hypothetical protein